MCVTGNAIRMQRYRRAPEETHNGRLKPVASTGLADILTLILLLAKAHTHLKHTHPHAHRNVHTYLPLHSAQLHFTGKKCDQLLRFM